MRYEIPLIEFKSIDFKGHISRRDYNERYNKPSPEVEIPEAGEYLWGWFFEVSDAVGRLRDGVCHPIPPSEWVAWHTISEHIVYRWEFAILMAMDVAYCGAFNNELADKRLREAPPTGKQG